MAYILNRIHGQFPVGPYTKQFQYSANISGIEHPCIIRFKECARVTAKYRPDFLSITGYTLQKQINNHTIGEFYQFNLSSCIRQQNSLTAQFVSFSLSNLANIFYPPQFLQ